MEKPSVARHWPLGRLIVAGAVVYLMTAWLLVIAVDVLHLGGAAERFAALAGETNHPGLWMQIFKEGSVTELLQWSLLAATGFTAGVLTGRLASDGLASARPFWTLMGVAGLAMLIEDAGNPRHTVTDYVEHAAGAGLAPGLANLAFMAALAAIPLYALLRHRSAVFHVVAAKRYLIAAFAVYGAAASASAVSALGTVYEGIGSFLEQTLFQGRLLTNPAFETTRSQGYLLMDNLVEESLELLGAALLLAAAVSFLDYARQRRVGDPVLTNTAPSSLDPAAKGAASLPSSW